MHTSQTNSSQVHIHILKTYQSNVIKKKSNTDPTAYMDHDVTVQ